MHPATSIIVFTVASGAGFGLMLVLGLPALWGDTPKGALFWVGFILAYGLACGGLVSSTFHLGHPERAWRAFSQWRSSWLSREGVLAVITLAIMGAYALAALADLGITRLLGPIGAVLALATVYATSMIYAQLRTVDRWHSPLTPVNFIAFSVASGLMLMACLQALFGDNGAGVWPLLAAIATFAAWSLRQRAWRSGDAKTPLSTPDSATGLGSIGSVRLFEAPHTGGSYLTAEMGFVVARRHAQKLRLMALAIGGFLPLILTLAASGGLWPGVVLLLGVVALLTGLLIERWLFFAEARHAVTAFYDRRTG